jgi:LPXTG-motif cell wall-anchored protein
VLFRSQTPHEDYQAGAFGDVVIGLLVLGLGLFFILPFFTILSDSAMLLVLGIYFVAIIAFIAFVIKKRRRKS